MENTTYIHLKRNRSKIKSYKTSLLKTYGSIEKSRFTTKRSQFSSFKFAPSEITRLVKRSATCPLVDGYKWSPCISACIVHLDGCNFIPRQE